MTTCSELERYLNGAFQKDFLIFVNETLAPTAGSSDVSNITSSGTLLNTLNVTSNPVQSAIARSLYTRVLIGTLPSLIQLEGEFQTIHVLLKECEQKPDKLAAAKCCSLSVKVDTRICRSPMLASRTNTAASAPILADCTMAPRRKQRS